MTLHDTLFNCSILNENMHENNASFLHFVVVVENFKTTLRYIFFRYYLLYFMTFSFSFTVPYILLLLHYMYLYTYTHNSTHIHATTKTKVS